MYVYKIICKVNDKIYVGQTKEDLQKRFKRHIGYQSIQNDTKFYRAIRKYGKENFVISLLDTALNQQELNDKEEYWILKLNAIDNGYNTALGRIGGDTLSKNPNLEVIKKKISNSKLGSKNPNSTAVYCINLVDGTKELFNSMIECQKKYNIPRHDIIRRRCTGKILKPYKNKYTFQYA